MAFRNLALRASWMRGGSSNGLFFRAEDLPANPVERDRLLLAAMGSPDPYGRQLDGLGGATSSTSKIVVISPSKRADCDVDYLFGHVSIDTPVIDYSGNCGNLSSAVGVFAIEQGFVKPRSAIVAVRVWQVNQSRRMIVHVPCDDQGPVTAGDYEVAGVSGSGAPIRVEFLEEGQGIDASVFPSGQVLDHLDIDPWGRIAVSLVNVGNPSVFVEPSVLGLAGDEYGEVVNGRPDLLEKVERIRRHAAVAMRLADSPEEAASRPGTPKLAWVSPPRDYRASNGRTIQNKSMDMCARIFSMGRLHHAFTGTGAVAIVVAAKIPGTLVHRCIARIDDQSGIRIGHPAGIMDADADVSKESGAWICHRASIIRTARTLMRGEVVISGDHCGPMDFDQD